MIIKKNPTSIRRFEFSTVQGKNRMTNFHNETYFLLNPCVRTCVQDSKPQCMLSSHQNLRSTKTGNSIERRARAFPRSCHSLTAVNSPFTRFVLMNSSLSLFLKTMKPETMYIYKILKIVLIFSFYIDARNYEVKIY